MSDKRKRHSSQFKFQVALEATKESKTVSQLASEHNVHPNQVSQWKKQLLDDGPQLFLSKREQSVVGESPQEAVLYEQIGRLKMELEWLKKKVVGVGRGAKSDD